MRGEDNAPLSEPGRDWHDSGMNQVLRISLIGTLGLWALGGVTPALAMPFSTGGSKTDSTGVRTFVGDRPPTVPGRPAVTPLADGGFRVIWQDKSSDETGFEIERYPAFSGGTRLVAANIAVFVDTDDRAKARYRVRAKGERYDSRWTTWIQGESLSAGFVRLTPGAGFTGPTEQPAAVGTPEMQGYDAKAIARWDVVPYQTFTGNFHVGVVAFHMNGIDRVDFSVNGGAWKSVREMKHNPRTNVWEYTALLKASDFADGPVEVRAVAWPRGAGEARVLGAPFDGITAGTGSHALPLFANGGNTLSTKTVYVAASGDDSRAGTLDAPVRTFDRAFRVVRTGGAPVQADVIVTEAGTYSLPTYSSGNDMYGSLLTSTAGWVTIKSAGSLGSRDVVVGNPARGYVRPRVAKLSLERVAVDFGTVSQFYMDSPVWFRDCHWFDSSGQATVYPGLGLPVRGQGYATNCTAEHLIYGFSGLVMARGVATNRVDGDVLSNTKLVLNARVENVGGTGGSGWHSDILQYFGHNENVIAYGVQSEKLTSVQSFFLDHYQSSHTDFAFVNIYMDNAYPDLATLNNGGAPFTQLNARHNHVLFQNVQLVNQRLIFRTDLTGDKQFIATNVIFDACSLHRSFDPTTLPAGVAIRAGGGSQ